jgi:hypothetical protein
MQARARVLRIIEGGLIVQFLHSNAVLRCSWQTDNVKPDQIKHRDLVISHLNARAIDAHKHEQILTLRVIKCAPPELTVEIESVELCAHPSGEGAQERCCRVEGAQRKRQFLGPLS